MLDMTSFVVHSARYAKGQMAVHCQSSGNGYKTRAMRLCCALRARYTNREHAYIMSPSKAAKLQKLFSEGWDASSYDGELYAPETAVA